jgi:hypothetical protein
MKVKLQPIPRGTLLNRDLTTNPQLYNDKFPELSDKKPHFISQNIFHEKNSLITQKLIEYISEKNLPVTLKTLKDEISILGT